MSLDHFFEIVSHDSFLLLYLVTLDFLVSNLQFLLIFDAASLCLQLMQVLLFQLAKLLFLNRIEFLHVSEVLQVVLLKQQFITQLLLMVFFELLVLVLLIDYLLQLLLLGILVVPKVVGLLFKLVFHTFLSFSLCLIQSLSIHLNLLVLMLAYILKSAFVQLVFNAESLALHSLLYLLLGSGVFEARLDLLDF